VTKWIRTTRLLTQLLVVSGVTFLPGCTDLKESPTSSITPDNFYSNEAEVLGGLAAVYAQLRSTEWSYYNLSEITADELIVPTRGQDWYDNGLWLEMDRMQYTESSPGALADVNSAWNDYFQGVARANVVLTAIENKPFNNKATITAELRALRAWNYYMLMDFFGGVPIVTGTKIEAQPRATRAELFTFIETELNAARPDLPDFQTADNLGRFTKFGVDAILASMYLNARVFTGDVTTAGLTPGPAKWAEAIAAADRIISSNRYSLATNWRSNFTATNGSSPENIFVIKHTNVDGLGLNFVMRLLHYNQFSPSPWNGFSTIAEVYNAFDAADTRRQIFLVGLQVDQDPKSATFNQPVKDRQGNPLIFTTSIADETKATEAEGARIMKWPPDPNHTGNDGNANDFAYFRYAEILLIKAEAMNERASAGDLAAAIGLVNTIRDRAFASDPTKRISLASNQAQVRTAIYQERLFELTGEAKRRQDLIRAYSAGETYHYLSAWRFKSAGQPYQILFPIPKTQRDNNAQLTQNAGY
jgi:starch-binding outer membrane protein, SusD/RagB family